MTDYAGTVSDTVGSSRERTENETRWQPSSIYVLSNRVPVVPHRDIT